MAPYLFWEFIILITGVWLMAVLFFVYGWLLLKNQRKMFQDILNTKASLPSKSSEDPPSVHLEISKDEPIGKYKDLAPDESVDVSFVDQQK